MSVVGIHHVTLLVRDEAKAAWFYGEVLGFAQKPRPAFNFPGLFYSCGNQELHLIVSARPLVQEDLFIDVGVTGHRSFRHIHRHAAFLVENFSQTRERLKDHRIEILFSEESPSLDSLSQNLVAGWKEMYGAVPIFVHDPFHNLLEIVPKQAIGS